ncbi:hypothetical protein, partial [Streptomyces sp. NPDC048419]|uniref:hypothetical protein n=1 Tax=Streptomyces sp. NPDC048419 TaxID=3365547 RepID=UPI00371CA6CB
RMKEPGFTAAQLAAYPEHWTTKPPARAETTQATAEKLADDARREAEEYLNRAVTMVAETQEVPVTDELRRTVARVLLEQTGGVPQGS